MGSGAGAGWPCLGSPKAARGLSACPAHQAIVDVMVNLQFTLVETLWKTFWRSSLSQPSEAPSLAV